MDRIAVCGTVDPGSIPSGRTSIGGMRRTCLPAGWLVKHNYWRVGRVVYGARLESVWAKVRRGSNPLPSALSLRFHAILTL